MRGTKIGLSFVKSYHFRTCKNSNQRHGLSTGHLEENMTAILMSLKTGSDLSNVLILGNVKELENALEESIIKETDGAKAILFVLNLDLSITSTKKVKSFGVTEALKIGKELEIKQQKKFRDKKCLRMTQSHHFS